MLNQTLTQVPPPTPKRRRAPLEQNKIDLWNKQLTEREEMLGFMQRAELIANGTAEWSLRSKASAINSPDTTIESLLDTVYEMISEKDKVEKVEEKEKEKEKEKEDTECGIIEQYAQRLLEEYFQNLISAEMSSAIDSPIQNVEKMLNILESGDEKGGIDKRTAEFLEEKLRRIQNLIFEGHLSDNRELLKIEIRKILAFDDSVSSDEQEKEFENIKRLLLICVDDEKKRGEKIVGGFANILEQGPEKTLDNIGNFLSTKKEEIDQTSDGIGRSLSASESVSVLFGICSREANKLLFGVEEKRSEKKPKSEGVGKMESTKPISRPFT